MSDNATVTVYTTPTCPQCTATKKKLTKLGVAFAAVDVSQDDQARDYVHSLGYVAAPVVVAGDDHWSGFRPNRLEELAS